MIHLTLAGKRIEVRGAYEQREVIKSLDSPPGVKWLPALKAWSLDARLYDKLAEACGRDFAPLSYEFLAALPLPEARRYGYFGSVRRNAEAAEAKGRVSRYGKRAVRHAHD